MVHSPAVSGEGKRNPQTFFLGCSRESQVERAFLWLPLCTHSLWDLVALTVNLYTTLVLNDNNLCLSQRWEQREEGKTQKGLSRGISFL